MRIHDLILISIFFLAGVTFADVCPSIKDIRYHQLNGWLAYDSDDNNKVSPERFSDFKKSVKEFALAEWQHPAKKKNSIHCFYRDQYGSNLDMYLKKDNLTPDNSKKYWYEVSGYQNCAAGMERCQFYPALRGNKLARN